MEANELRYNNLILYKENVIPVTMIGEYGIQSNNNGKVIYAKFATPDLTPIHLTEEWLIRLGFKEEDGVFILENILVDTKEYFVFIKTRHPGAYIELISTPYVHQLQNLYYSITGKELNVLSINPY